MCRYSIPAALSAGVHSRGRQLLMSIRLPPTAGNRMPSGCGNSSSAAITLRRIGIRRLERAGFAYVFSSPFVPRACSTTSCEECLDDRQGRLASLAASAGWGRPQAAVLAGATVTGDALLAGPPRAAADPL